MNNKTVNLVKLCVGSDGADHLARWQEARLKSGAYSAPEHVTRMRPRRAEEVLNGGSLYWVFQGWILARQRIVALDDRRGEDGKLRCALVFDPQIIRTVAVPRRPFQGWRYLEVEDSPPDLAFKHQGEISIPDDLAQSLAEIGVIQFR